MTLVERTFALHGTDGLGDRPRPELIAPVLRHVHGNLMDSARMAFLHSSRARGRAPTALAKATEVRFVGHSPGEGTTTLLRFVIPRLGEAAAELFRQLPLWETGAPTPEQTAFELFAESLNDIGSRRKESDRYDQPMLRRVLSCRRWLRHGLSAITLPDAEVAGTARIDEEVVRAAQDLSGAVPASKRVRMTGRLDLLGVSQRVLKIHVGANVVTVLWEGSSAIHDLRDLLTHDVVVEGEAIFRPSGTLLRVDATALAPAASSDEYFRRLPLANASRDYAAAVKLRPSEPSAYKAIRGLIPAEESDEDFAAGLAAMR